MMSTMGDSLIPLLPSFSNSVLGVKGDDGASTQLNILRHLVEQCTSVDLPSDDSGPSTSTPVRQRSAVEDTDHVDILLSVITAVTDCVMLGLTKEDADNDIIKDLFQCKRPAHPFFSQVYKKSDNGLPLDALATFCDVSVVKFFSRCNTYSSCHAVDWCLQYLLKMFSALDPVLQKSGSGWYNAKVKARKASSIVGAHLMQFNNAQMGGAAGSGDHQNTQPQRRRSGCVDYTKLDMTQLDAPSSVSTPETVTLDSYTPPVTSMVTHFGSSNTRSKRTTFRSPAMIPIAEEPPDIISSNTIDMSIVRFSPDLTEPCSPGNDPLVCMPQPDSLPSSPTGSYTEAEVTYKKKSVRFENSNGDVDLVEYELQSGMSCEGRVGLIAILNAIAKLPVNITTRPTEEKTTTGKVYEDNSLWNEAICGKVFKLIQKCINSSMFTEQDTDTVERTSDEASNLASYKRRAYRLNRTKPKRSVQQKSLLASYFGHVMEYGFQALVQCALFIRCSAKTICHKQLVKYTALCTELHEKLSTICTHSGAAFKQCLQEFVKKESVEKVLAFLHATLGFCAPAADDDNLGNRYEHKVKIVVSVLKTLMDKIVCLDLTESHVMKMNITYEACRLVAYSLDLLSDETFEEVQHEYHSLKLKKYVMYIQRLVLPSISPITRNIRDNNRVSGSVSNDDFMYTSTGLRVWNNLPIDELKLHLERFVVLMHLSEPGTIPSAGLLASIVDMTSLPVLVRAAVFFECALFVNRIRNGWLPPSLEVNFDGCKNVLINFRQWGEAVGSKLEELDESDQEKTKEEEPVLSRETSKGYFRISFSLKMMACQLLTEITYLLRDPPSRYNPYIPTISSPNSTTQNTPRPSNITAPMDYSKSEYDETAATSAMTISLDQPRSSAGSLEPGVIHSRSNSLDVPRHLPILFDQGSDTSGGEEICKKSVTLDTPVVVEFLASPITPTTRTHLNPFVPPTTPDAVPSIVIASPTTAAQRQHSMVRRGSLPQGRIKLKLLTGSFDKQTNYATSPTSYLHRKLSTFKDSFRRVKSVAMKSGSRKSAVTKVSSPLLSRRKSLSTPMSRAGSHKSLCDDPLCNSLPWLSIVTKLYHHDMLHKQDNTLLASYKMCCAELEGALRRLYTLPSCTTSGTDNSEIDGRRYTLSLDDSAFHHSSSLSRRDKVSSFTSSWTGSFSSPGTFRFSRASISFGFPFRRHSQITTHRESTIQENRVSAATSLNKSLLYDEEELFGDNIEGALEKHAMMLQNRRIKENDDRKIKYLNKEVKGLLHTPFTILQLAMAANLIDAVNIVSVQEICWHLLLDTNQELVQSAAMTFLWTVEKCKTLEFNSFFNQNVVIDSSVSKKLKSITRFMVLWRNRHNCSLNEKDALRRLKMKNSPIGYALPSPLLGLPVSDIPVAPWESYTVCSADNCEGNAARCHKPTRLVPKLHHLKDLKILSQSFFVSGISVAKKSVQEWLRSPADTESASATMTTDAATVSTNNQTALFPSSLLCFLQFLIDSVTISDSANEPLPSLYPTGSESTRVPCTSVSDAARMVLWTCMVEDHDLFFQPFLGCFKRENMSRPTYNVFPVDLTNQQQLENVLHSLRCLLIVFPKLPSEAAQYLFNHLIGVIMQHRLQPYNCSNIIISEVLVLLRDVAPSVEGLDCKVLKNVLKKEKCYNTVMTTANLQAVQGKYFIVKVKCGIDHLPPTSSFCVYANTTFRELTSEAIKKFKSSLSDSFKLDNCILIDDVTKQPMLDDLFIQDHYYSSVRDSHSQDDRYIVFRLQQSNHADKLSFERRSLFWYKMGEISRIVISIHMLFTGPSNLSADGKISATSLPHYKFMHNELSELGSFPRKALDNILHLNGPVCPSVELRITDIMLKGVWIHFIFKLFQKMPANYTWSHEIIYFISVVTGSLLLYADDAIILQCCLSTLLLAATKFNDIFKQRGYNTVVPILAQVYTLHHHNKVVLQGIEHIWGKFYLLNDNVFVMQAVTSLAALLCTKTNDLEGNTQLSIVKPPDSFVSDFSPDDVQQRAQSVKAIFQLIKSLQGQQEDVLDIEDRILPVKITRQNSQHYPQSSPSNTQEFLYTVFDLCIAVSGAHPDSLRGMQMMVFLDHHMQLFLHEFDQLNDERWNKHIIGIKALVKGAESLIRVFRMQQRRGITTGATGGITIVHQDSNAIPLTTTFASLLHRLTRLNTAIKSAMSKGEEENSDQEGYRKDLVEAHWKRTRISSVCLLSLCSKFVHHLTPALKRSFSRYSNTVQMLAELFCSEVKLLTVPTPEKLTLENRGLTLFMTHFLPSLSWAEERSIYPTFSFVLKSLGKLFRKYQAEPPSKETWDVLVRWVGGIASCLTASGLAYSQNKIVKTFIDNITGNGLPADSNVSETYLESWPWEFSRSVVLIIYQMIKHDIASFSNYMTDVVKGKSFIKILLIPFCVEYGQHECLKSSKLMRKILEIIESHLRPPKQVQCGMQALRAFALSFVDLMESVDWNRICLLLTTVIQKKCAVQCSTTTLHNPVPQRTFKPSLETLKSVIEFCSPFLSSCQTSLGLLLKALLTQVESKLRLLEPQCKQGPMVSELSQLIDNCRLVKSHSLVIGQFSKTALLGELESDLINEVGTDCNPPMVTESSEAAKAKFVKKKKNRLKTTSSFKGESGLELIKEDAELSSPIESLTAGATEQHRRSPRRTLQRDTTLSDSDEDSDGMKEQFLPTESRKRTRTIKSRLLALHKQPTEDYDGDYEDEIPTPGAVSFDIPDKVFGYSAEHRPTTLVEVHHSLKRSRSSDSSVETSNDNASLIPNKAASTSAVRKLSFDRHSVSSPSIKFNLMEPLRQHGNNSLKQLKVVFLKGHSSSYESTV